VFQNMNLTGNGPRVYSPGPVEFLIFLDIWRLLLEYVVCECVRRYIVM
jgi:hypothetical protein